MRKVSFMTKMWDQCNGEKVCMRTASTQTYDMGTPYRNPVIYQVTKDLVNFKSLNEVTPHAWAMMLPGVIGL